MTSHARLALSRSGFQPVNLNNLLRSTELLLLKGELILEMAQYGESLWSWLGRKTFEEFTLSGISYPLRMSFPHNLVAKMWRLPRHLFLFWLRGLYKSTMIEWFLKLLEPSWPTHSIGVATAESLRGSVSGKGSYVFHPPGILMGNVVAIPEFHNITAIRGVGPILLDWWGTGDISVDLVKISSALQNPAVVDRMKTFGVEVLDGRYRFHADSIGMSACHTKTNKLGKFPPAVYDRLLVLYHEPEVFTGLPKEVAKRVKNADQDTSILREAWKFYGGMRVGGDLPDLPDAWIDDLPDKVESRRISNYASTVYSHAFIMQPKRHGDLNTPYPRLILEEADHRFALDRIGKYQLGQDAILENLRGVPRKRDIEQELLEFIKLRGSVSASEAASEFGRTPRRMRQILSGLEGKEVEKSGSSGPGVRWHRIT